MSSYEYDVAVSFAGADRDIAERFASLLAARGHSVFYDDWEKSDLWGKDLFQHLDEVYTKKARFCVAFLSEAYSKRAWTTHELKAAQARAFQEKGEYLLPVRLDDTEIPGIRNTLGYLDLRQMTIEQVAEQAAQKIAAHKGLSSSFTVSPTNAPSTQKTPLALSTALQVKSEFSDLDRDAFLEDAFELVSESFREALSRLNTDSPGLVGKFRKIHSNHFSAVVYKGGKIVAQCGIRLDGSFGRTTRIAYSSDPASTNSMNEWVTVTDAGNQLLLSTGGMTSMFSPNPKQLLSPDEAAEFLWKLLISPLQH